MSGAQALSRAGFPGIPSGLLGTGQPVLDQDAIALDLCDGREVSGLREATSAVLEGLTARESKVLRMRFGIDMNTDHTLEEVGKQFDVTRERIRQIEAKALRKLRHPSRSEHLKSFLDSESLDSPAVHRQ